MGNLYWGMCLKENKFIIWLIDRDYIESDINNIGDKLIHKQALAGLKEKLRLHYSRWNVNVNSDFVEITDYSNYPIGFDKAIEICYKHLATSPFKYSNKASRKMEYNLKNREYDRVVKNQIKAVILKDEINE